jgi:hypothetical protein
MAAHLKEDQMGSRCLVTLVLTSTLALCASTGAGAPNPAPAGTSRIDPASADGVPGAELATARVHRYRMSGAVRPLLFWIGRDDIGLAQITWRRGPDGARGYELLVGTDPARAPRSLNRWGYIAEEAFSPADGSVLAMMTGSQDASCDREAASAARTGGQGDFRTIRARLQNGAATWQVARVQTPVALTIRDKDAALDRVRQDTTRTTPKEIQVASDSRSGFLVAVAELIDGVVRSSSNPSRARADARVQYVFGGEIYELQLRSADALVASYGGRPTPAVRACFDIQTLATGERTRFELTSATRGSMAGVPLSVEWQPRWWLKVRLDVEDPDHAE